MRRLERLERTEDLGRSSTNGGTTRWKDTNGNDQVVIGLQSGGSYGITMGPGGVPVTQIAVYAVALTPTSVAAGTVSRQTFTVNGLTTADKVIVNPPAMTTNAALAAARVSAANTLELTFVNPQSSGGAVPTAGTFLILAFRS